jgi:hypothetical protein
MHVLVRNNLNAVDMDDQKNPDHVQLVDQQMV